MRRNFLNKFVDGFRSRGMPVLAGVSGNLMEWYDFGLYGVLAATLGKLFFSDGGGFVGLLAVYGVFAAGYLARVAGGMMLGHIADRYGRRRSLLLSAFAMALAQKKQVQLPGAPSDNQQTDRQKGDQYPDVIPPPQGKASAHQPKLNALQLLIGQGDGEGEERSEKGLNHHT